MAYDLERFVAAQEGMYPSVVAELRAGRKTGHWMWFVFPQVAGLGMSEMSRRYAIGSLDEAVAYLEHPVLGPRLRECAGIVLATEGRSAEAIFGGIDADEAALVDDAVPSRGSRRDGVQGRPRPVLRRGRGPGHRRAARAHSTSDSIRGVSSPAPRVPIAVVVGLFVASLALRMQLLSIGPLLPLIRADLGLSAAPAGLLTTIPVLCMGLFAPFGPRLASRLGPGWRSRRASR